MKGTRMSIKRCIEKLEPVRTTEFRNPCSLQRPTTFEEWLEITEATSVGRVTVRDLMESTDGGISIPQLRAENGYSVQERQSRTPPRCSP